ncbi:hypothetical protein ABE29_23010 [Cytobacillus firmus]|uniref:hypothetical protein n=1 Tax=Cytobacillus firmus TaxID=1399 RepID=UPI00077CC3FF|nr:hypothetical protein [Cytobacillus firmus]MBG9545513.1 hypothetical protein [Cytobacillus firmus]MBG9551172.1 hypothetical protein [Cytobacillus firmus]MBG9557954.1 hypothetical protein [Cytobacillus firmus]MBG9577578.1 hypothetical protein [Cytobacillus firmus]MEC1891661.1 hypothetical protein [Cytobacillus firmus]
MATQEVEKPIYDERVNEILQGLAAGLTRDELAEMFGHTNYKSVDMYMRRKNFTWDSTKQTYVPKLPSAKEYKNKAMPHTKATIVIDMMKEPDFMIEEICKKAGFKDYKELAEYMTAKGYQWSPDDKNYKKKTGHVDRIEPKKVEVPPVQEVKLEVVETKELQVNDDVINKLQSYLPLFDMLEKNKEKLLELVMPMGQSDTIPRYIIPGRTSGKTIQMSESLQDMAVEYCNQRNIKQRELFEVAVIEFFQKYGFEYEIESLLKTNS